METSQLITTYGPSKHGKTLCACRTFPKAKVFTPSAQSLIPVVREAGFEPNHQAVITLEPILKFIREHQDDDKLQAVIIDDISLIAEESRRQYEDKLSGFKLWDAIKYEIQELCLLARFAPWHMVLTAHEVAPGADDTGLQRKGGPKMPSTTSGEELQKHCSLVLRLVAETGGDIGDVDPPFKPSWPVIYSCSKTGLNTNFTTGDRNGIALQKNPLNLRELFHAGGIDFPRAFDWQEEAVEKLAKANKAGLTNKEALAKTVQALKDKYQANYGSIATTLHDAWARSWWNRHKQDKLDALLESF